MKGYLSSCCLSTDEVSTENKVTLSRDRNFMFLPSETVTALLTHTYIGLRAFDCTL